MKRHIAIVCGLLAISTVASQAGRLAEPPARPARAVAAAPALPAVRRRPWSFRLAVLLGVVVAVVAIRVLRSALWGDGIAAQGWFPVLVSHTTLLWALPAVPCLLALSGFLRYGGLPERSAGRPTPDRRPQPCANLVCFRIVSRGHNVDALRATVANVRQQMAALSLFRYVVEVVTDEPVAVLPGRDLRCLVVPPGYQTRNRSRYKARALQYAVEQSPLPDDAWILHLDEESHLSSSVVIGVRDAVVEEERSGAHRIGQGAILYHRNLGRHPFLTLADMVRTGDDLGRFHFQHRLGVTLFGLHGSFILVRNSVERRCDFDFGPEGSVTEDAFWAVRQMALGTRCRWVDGFVVEQSTQSLADFVKQRRRWFAGLLRVVLYAEAGLWLRVSLAAFVALWAVAWLGMATTLVNLFLGLRTPPVVAAAGDLSLATFVTTYVVGLYVNLRESAPVALPRRVLLYVAQVVLIPAFALLEACGVVAGMVRPERGFHVVRKSAAASVAGAFTARSGARQVRVRTRPYGPTEIANPPGRTACRTPTTSVRTRRTTLVSRA